MLTARFRQPAKNALIREEQNDLAFNYIQPLVSGKKDPYDIRGSWFSVGANGRFILQPLRI